MLPSLGQAHAELHCARNRERADVPEVEIRGKLTGAVFFRMVAGLGIVGQTPVTNSCEDARGLLASSVPAGSWTD